MDETKPMLRVIVRARENGGYRYQIFTVGSADPHPFQSDNVTYATRQDAETPGRQPQPFWHKDEKGRWPSPVRAKEESYLLGRIWFSLKSSKNALKRWWPNDSRDNSSHF